MQSKTLLTNFTIKISSLLLVLFLGAIMANAQTGTVSATGTSGSYTTGTATSAGVRTEGTMTVTGNTTTTQNAYAVFNLANAAVPAGATITGVTVTIVFTTSSTGTPSSYNVYGTTTNLSTITSGATLYTDISNGTLVSTTSWGTASATKILTFNAAGVSFITNNITGIISLGFATGSANRTYTISNETSANAPLLTITYVTSCTAVPAPGAVAATKTTGCAPYASTLSLTGATVAAGISYQWQSSTDNSTWTNVTGATNATYAATVSSNIYYQCVLTCSAVPASPVAATSIFLAFSGATPIPWSEGFEGITSQTFPPCWASTAALADISNSGKQAIYSSSGPAYPSSGLVPHTGNGFASFNYTATNNFFFTPGFSLTGGQTYQFSMWYITDGAGGNTSNGIYSFSIRYGTNQTAGAQNTGTLIDSLYNFNNTTYTQRIVTFTPASSGTYYFGIKAANASGGTNYYWSFDDVALQQLNGCTGTPTAGTISPATSTVNAACGSSSQTFALSGYTAATGVTFQWQQSTDGTNYTPIAGATGLTCTATFTTAGANYINCVVTCTNSGQSATSTPATVTYYATQPYVAVTSATPYIQGFENAWINKCNTDDAPDVYWVNTPATGDNSWRRNDDGASGGWDTYDVGYQASPTSGSTANGASSAHCAMFNSYDEIGSGTLDLYLDLSAGASEQISFDYQNASGEGDKMQVQLSTTGAAGPFTTLTTVNESNNWETITLPITTSSNQCVLRFKGTGTGNYEWDLGLDNVSVYVLSACTGTPTAGIIASSTGAQTCDTTHVTLSLLGSTVALGLTYQWQSSSDGTTFTPIQGATNNTYTFVQAASTYYNCIVTCSGNNATSNTQYLQETPCYCSITFTDPTYCYGYTLAVTGGGLNYSATGCPATSNFTNLSATVQTGVPTTFNILNSTAYYGVGVWVDFNNNGSFSDPGEQIYIGNYGTQQSFPFTMTVPITVPSGSYRMRVLSADDASGSAGACASTYEDGSYEDFTLNVQGATLSATPSSLPAFSAQACGVSGSQSFNINGQYLTGGITVTAPLGFEVSQNGFGYAPTTTVISSGGTASATILVKFDPSVAGPASGNITFSSTGLNNPPTVAVSGIGSGLTVTASTVALGNSTVGVPSAGVADTLKGYNLTVPDNIIVTVTGNSDFQVSSDSATWGATCTIVANSPTLIAPVYTRVTPSVSGTETPATMTISDPNNAGLCTPTYTATATGTAACATPGVPTNMTYTGTGATGTTVNVTPNGTPDGYLLVESIAPYTGSTTNGQTYAVNAPLGNGTVIANTASQTISVTGLTGNTTYYFTLIAYTGGPTGTCGGGPLYGAPLSTATTTCIGTPVLTAATGVTSGAFNINWTAPSSGGAFNVSYTVDVSTNSGFTAPIAGSPFTVTPPATTLALTGLSASTTYSYRVTAVTGNGNCTPVPSGTGTQATPSCTAPTWLGTTSSDWSTGSNWSCGVAPTTASAVVIPLGTTVMPVISSGAFTITSLTVHSGATLTIASGATLSITAAAGAIVDSGAIAGAGTVILAGTSTTSQKYTGNGTISNLTLNNSHGAAITSPAIMNVTGILTITLGTFTGNSGIVLVSNAAGTASIGPISGTLTAGTVKVQQYIPGVRGFRFLGHPFTGSLPLSQLTANMDITGQGGTTNGFTTTNSNNPSAFWYNPVTGNGSTVNDSTGWIPFTSTAAIGNNAWKTKEGIRILVRGQIGQGLDGSPYTPLPVTLNMTGSVNTGTLTETMLTGPQSGYNLLSNPYPSPTDIGTVINNAVANMSGSLYWIWNPEIQTEGAYVPVTIGSGVYYIPANSSYVVNAAVNNSTLSFAETNKGAAASTTAQTFRLTDNMNNGITLHLYDSAMHPWDMVYVSFNNNASNNIENYDGRHLHNSALDFYSLSSDNQMLSLDARPYITGQVIPLGIATDVPQKYIIKAEDFSLPSNEEVYLHDKYLGQYQQLQDGSQYTFSITADPSSQGNNRFELSMAAAATTGINNANGSNGLKVSMVPNPATEQVTITYEAPRSEKTSVRILNMAGQQIVNMELGDEQQGSVVIPLHNVAAGMYMVELISGSQIVTQRLVKQ